MDAFLKEEYEQARDGVGLAIESLNRVLQGMDRAQQGQWKHWYRLEHCVKAPYTLKDTTAFHSMLDALVKHELGEYGFDIFETL